MTEPLPLSLRLLALGKLRVRTPGRFRRILRSIRTLRPDGLGVFLLHDRCTLLSDPRCATHGDQQRRRAQHAHEGTVGAYRAGLGSAPAASVNRSPIPSHSPRKLITMTAERRIKIFDTTLRDGEQSPGAQHEPRPRSWRSPRPWSTWASTSSRPAFRSPRRATSRRSARSPAQIRGADDLRPGPLQRRRHRSRLGSAARTPSSRASTSSWPPAPSIASSS